MIEDIKKIFQRRLNDLSRCRVIDLESYRPEKNVLFKITDPSLYLEKDGKFYYNTQLIHLNDYLEILENLSDDAVFSSADLMEELCKTISKKLITLITTQKLEELTEVAIVVSRRRTFAKYHSHRVLRPLVPKSTAHIPAELLEYDFEKIYNRTCYDIQREIKERLSALGTTHDLLELQIKIGADPKVANQLFEVKRIINHLDVQNILVTNELEILETGFQQWKQNYHATEMDQDPQTFEEIMKRYSITPFEKSSDETSSSENTLAKLNPDDAVN